MGLLIGIVIEIATIAFALSFAEVDMSNDDLGTAQPPRPIIVFVIGSAIAGVCIATHFHWFGW